MGTVYGLSAYVSVKLNGTLTRVEFFAADTCPSRADFAAHDTKVRELVSVTFDNRESEYAKESLNVTITPAMSGRIGYVNTMQWAIVAEKILTRAFSHELPEELIENITYDADDMQFRAPLAPCAGCSQMTRHSCEVCGNSEYFII